MLAVIRKYAPSTLERYLRIANQFLGFLESCDIAFSQVTLAAVLDYLAAARASRSQDLEIHRISATSAIKALRWFHKLSQWEQLTPAMQSPVITAYCSQSSAKDRREAMPIPMALISAWEQRVCDPDAPLCTVLCLGAALLATHASLRFGDIQRVDFSSLSLTTAALHGVCFATKTTSQGQLFAVTIAGITGRDSSSCWPLHWLSALQRAASPFRAQDGDPDFLWFSTAPELNNLLELAPASYCTALLVLRWAATLPWHPATPCLSALEASQLTLHSMKSTVLAAAAQLRLSKDIRLSQGHHRDSAALYSRNDTFDSLFAQRRLSIALSRGPRAAVRLPRLCLHLSGFLFARASPQPFLLVLKLHQTPLGSMADASAASSLESPLALKQLLSSLQVPEELIHALQRAGIDTVPDFAFAYATAQELDVFCSEEQAELWDTLGVSDPTHSPAMARLRRALHKAKHLTEAADSAPSASSSNAPSTAQLQPNAWAEHAPPRLDSASIAQLVKDFQQNYPGEHLDGDAMPSVRLLSIVHRWFVPGNAISWIPWQLRLSEKTAAFLSAALFDDTPEMPVAHLRLSPAWLGRIQTVFRNAIALCKGAHLQRLKAYDKKVLDLATQAPTDPSLRTVSTSELVSADRKLWKEISSLHSSGWTLDDALHEMTTVRSDVGNLLQLRARPPPPPLRPPRDPNAPLRGKGKTGKGNPGKGNAPPLKRKTPGATGSSDTAQLDLVKNRDSSAQAIAMSLIFAQPKLNVLQCLASALQDKDSGLPALLAEGVPTGAFEPLPSSGQWTPAQPELDFSQEFSPASLEHCRGNWLAAESNQELLEQLVQDEVAKGFVKPFDGDEADDCYASLVALSLDFKVGNIKISTKSDVKESKFVLAWLAQCFAHEQPRSLRTAPRLHCYSAADAFADTARIGIGGWLSTASEFIWFSEIFTADQVRAQWPQLHGSMQPYIGCFETLAQLALAQCTWHCLRCKHVKFVLPSATDNTSAESGLNKLFSTAEPLGLFLRLAATWAHLHRVQFELEHLAGEKNVWADKLSRDNISFLQHRSAERRRISLAELASASHCVTLHDTGHAWPAPLVRAQHAMLR
ncbi:unnamed protein product [Symbiodinium sp. KB8]|nr:unnamed protein product [Symbiodinium sp. KB8]